MCVGNLPRHPLGHPQEHDGAASLDRRSAASADLPSQRLAPLTSGRTGWPSGTSGTPTWASSSAKSLSCGAPTGVSARRVPATAPRVPPSLRRPRASHTSTTTYAFRYSHLPRFWLRPALCGTTLGLTQAPRCAVHWKWKGVGTLLSNYRRLWTDNLLAKRRRTAVRRPRRISYGPTDAAAERGSSSPSSARSPALRFRALGGGTDTDEREVARQMGSASRADRYRLLVGASGVEALGPGVGLLPDDQVRQPSRIQNTLL